jgi:putative PIN family toxin of toxin-antitoxin system
LVSALLAPNGNEALILLAVSQGLLLPCMSQSIVAEYEEVLIRPKFSFAPEHVTALLAMLGHRGEIFRPGGSQVVSSDPADTKFIQCAIAGQAEFIITGNKRHFPDSPYGTAHVVNAAELLNRITVEL